MLSFSECAQDHRKVNCPALDKRMGSFGSGDAAAPGGLLCSRHFSLWTGFSLARAGSFNDFSAECFIGQRGGTSGCRGEYGLTVDAHIFDVH
jgi:hypothetical protein